MRRYHLNTLVHKYFYLGAHRGGIRAIFWGSIFRQLASSTVGLFVPIYVYEVGLSLVGDSFITGVRVLLLFLLVWRLSCIIFCLFVEQLVDSIGFRRTLLLSSFMLICEFIVLMFAKDHLGFLWIAAILGGMVTSTYWISRHALFGEDQDVTHIGTSTGMVIVFSRLAAIIGPVVGGLIGTYYGFRALFSLGLFLIVLSSIPYFFMKHHHRHHPDGFKGLLDKIRDIRNIPLMIAWFGRSWDDELIINFWPLFIFLTVGALAPLGFVTSLVSVVSMILSYFSGYVFDKTRYRTQAYVVGSILTAVMWPIKSLTKSIGSIFLVDSLQAMSGSFYSVPFLSQTYQFASRRDPVAFFAFREIIWSLGVIFFLFLIFLLTLSWSWSLLFFFGSLGVVLSITLIFYRQFEL